MKPIYEKVNRPKDQSFFLEEVTKPYFPDPWHYHPEVEILYIKNGSGTNYVGDSVNTFYPGDLVIVGSNVPHVWSCSPEYLKSDSELLSSAICIQFMENTFGNSITDCPEFFRISELLYEARRGLQFLNGTLANLTKQIQGLISLTGMKRLLGLLAILDTMSTSNEYRYLSNSNYKPIIINSEDKQRMEIIYQYVIKNYPNKISLTEISELVHLVPHSFCRYFKSRTNKVFSSFVSEVRVGNACKLLIENKHTIADICYLSGFNYMSNFNRQFKKIKGLTPSEFYLKHKI